jgi:hypothetical protein
MTLSSLSTPIIPKNQKSVAHFLHFFDLRCKDKYKINFLLVINYQKFILQRRSSNMELNKKDKTVFRQKIARDSDGRVICPMQKEV